MTIKLVFHVLALLCMLVGGAWGLTSSNNRIVIFIVVGLIAIIFEAAIPFLKVSSDIQSSPIKEIIDTVETARTESSVEHRKITDKIATEVGVAKQEIIAEIKKVLIHEDADRTDSVDELSENKYQLVISKSASFSLLSGLHKQGGFICKIKKLKDGWPNTKAFFVDLLGGVNKDRISLYVDSEGFLVCQVLTANFTKHQLKVDISSWKKNESHTVITQWSVTEKKLELYVDGKGHVKEIADLEFVKMGPISFLGIDFEGDYPSDEYFLIGMNPQKLKKAMESVGLKTYPNDNRDQLYSDLTVSNLYNYFIDEGNDKYRVGLVVELKNNSRNIAYEINGIRFSGLVSFDVSEASIILQNVTPFVGDGEVTGLYRLMPFHKKSFKIEIAHPTQMKIMGGYPKLQFDGKWVLIVNKKEYEFTPQNYIARSVISRTEWDQLIIQDSEK